MNHSQLPPPPAGQGANAGPTLAQQIIDFNLHLHYDGPLPEGFTVLNPFAANLETRQVMRTFYEKFYGDRRRRRLILGINPGRHGAGITGVPFTDTKRLASDCGITMGSAHSHEISSVFIYDLIRAYGGVERFYGAFYINSPFPLAIVRERNGKQVNANYYDDKALFAALEPFMIECLRAHVQLGLDTSRVFVLGTKNRQFIERLNQRAGLFDELVTLEHPRYIQQYKSRDKDLYIDRFIKTLGA